MVFLSLASRLIVNVEALNMVESVGNVTRHRRATIVYRRGDSYVIRVVPAVSGECLAHAYQSWIVEVAKKRGLPLCEYCERQEFLKHCDTKLFGSKPWEIRLRKLVEGREDYDPHEVEKTIISNCIVEDIGGFLFPGRRPVKRTSRFMIGYMIPSLDAIEKCSIEPQFHVRSSPSRPGEQAQMIYYVEVASAPYMLTFCLDIDGIGKTSMIRVEDVVDQNGKLNRIKVALDALGLMLDSKIFGAKLSRLNPVMEYEVILATLSRSIPFTISPPTHKRFVEETLNRINEFKNITGDEVKVFLYSKYDEYLKQIEGRNNVEKVGNPLELTKKIYEAVEAWIKGSR